ncbi:MAG TPA: DUF507 family protein [Candidatus Binatia bacterium]|nr:DUF507 family protein [Candidatus Binatia bacterium]
MNRLSDNRINALARLVLRELAAVGEVVNERATLAESKRVLSEHFQRNDKIDELVRRKIASLSRRVVPGSMEWDVLYRRYFEEESRKHKF